MNTGMIAVRYARALLEFACERSEADLVYAETGRLADSFVAEPLLGRTLDSPVLPVNEKAALVKTAAGGTVSGSFERFIGLVMHNRRESFLQSIALMYRDLYRKRNGISVGSLETAVPVTPETEKRIAGLIASETGGQVELTTKVRPELIGGFVFEMNFRRLDASVAAQLRSVRRQFVEKNRRIV